MMKIIRVEKEGKDLNIARKLFVEYAEELNENLSFQSFDDEIEKPLKKYGKPTGSLLMAYREEVAAGCVALQALAEPGVCEMKRLYVKPEFRKFGVGHQLVQEILNEAKALGYKKMVLDTLQKLQPAIKLYQQSGFITTSAYYDNPLPNVVYMEKNL